MAAKKLATQTLLVQGGVMRSAFGETAEALYLTSGFVYDSAEQSEGTFAGTVEHYRYSRGGNPTITMLETRLAELEGAEACRATASGMAAMHAAVLSGLKPGDRVVASRALFGSTYWIVATLLPHWGVETEFVEGTDLGAWKKALARKATLVILETPSNPMLEIIDLAEVAKLAHQAGALVVVDNVFATPLLQHPLALGADVVVYSTTKHMDGQGRVLGGAVLGSKKWIVGTLQPFLRNTGGVLSPFNAWLVLKGLETLALRVTAQTASAARIADFLAKRSEVARVWYPFRADHPQVALAKKQMSGGGTMVTFALKGGKAAAFAFMNALKVAVIANNLGDTKSIATHPATTTHAKLTEAERARLGITGAVIRFSVGLEDPGDLEDDLGQALEHAHLAKAAE